MAQAGFTPILIYASSTPGALPSAGDLTSSASGAELAINYADGKLYFKNSSGVVTLLAGSSSGPAGGSNTQVQYNSSGVLAGSSNMTFDGTSLTLGGNPTLSAGTANGVLYLNGSKVATSGSALTFDGTSLGVTSGGSTPALQVFGASTSQGQIQFGSVNGYLIQGGADYLGINFNTNNATRYSISDTGVSVWSVAGSEQMRLTSTGLGIGTSSPAGKLHVAGQTRIQDSANAANYILIGSGANAPRGGNSVMAQTGSMVMGTEAASNLIFITNAAEAARFDSSGNLGLGVTPSAWQSTRKALQVGSSSSLHNVSNNTFVGNNFYSDGTSRYLTTGFAGLYGQESDGAHKWYTAPSGTAGNTISFTQAMTLDASGNLTLATGSVNSSAWYGINSASIVSSGSGSWPLLLGINGTEKARITSGGDLLVGVTNFTDAGGGVAVASGAASENVRSSATSTGTWGHYGLYNSNGRVGLISTNGTATTYATSSDYRLKDNPQPLTNSGAFIDALQPKTWEWKTDGSRGVGFIAHEVQAVSPASVVGEKDAVDADGKPIMQAMEYGSAEFIANIIAELQSLRQRVALLEGN